MTEQAGLEFDRTGQWVEYVLAGADRDSRRSRLASVPDLLRDAVRQSVEIAWSRRTRFAVPEGARWIPCRSCRQAITFVETPSGKKMPVNADGTAHWSTCSEAGRFRR